MRKPVNKETFDNDDIISQITSVSTEDKEIIRDIISLFMKDASAAIKEEKSFKLPYIGTFQKNIFRSRFNSAKKGFKELRGRVTKEEYKKEVIQIRKRIREELRDEQKKTELLRKLRKQHKKEYEIIFTKRGPKYADDYLYFTYAAWDVVPFDEDVEYALQELWRLENET